VISVAVVGVSFPPIAHAEAVGCGAAVPNSARTRCDGSSRHTRALCWQRRALGSIALVPLRRLAAGPRRARPRATALLHLHCGAELGTTETRGLTTGDAALAAVPRSTHLARLSPHASILAPVFATPAGAATNAARSRCVISARRPRARRQLCCSPRPRSRRASPTRRDRIVIADGVRARTHSMACSTRT
jgi:hypothetical protein